MKPWMHEKEIQKIETYLQPSMDMLEYGSGGSTLHFPKFVRNYGSIEHNLEWAEKLTEEGLPHNVKCIYSPRKDNTEDPYFYYINAIDLIPIPVKFDAVLIDGRERVRCARKVLERIHDDSVVFIHDFFMKGREKYREVLSDYIIIDKVDDTPQTLVVLRREQ